jgi:site-specific recombinase XerD
MADEQARPVQAGGAGEEEVEISVPMIASVDGDRQVQAPVLELPPPLRADSSIEQGIDAFVEFMDRKGFSDNTKKAFQNDLKLFRRFMEDVLVWPGPKVLHRISTEYLEQFLQWLQYGRDAECSAKTLARRITTLKVFFGWTHGIGVLGTDPAAPVVQLSVRTQPPLTLSDDEIEQVLACARHCWLDADQQDVRPLFLVTLLLQSGIKKGECCNLQVDDFDWTDPQAPSVQITYPDKERNSHKIRQIRLESTFEEIYYAYLHQYKREYMDSLTESQPHQSSPYLFECTPRNLEYVLSDVGKMAGLDGARKLGFEVLRWTAAKLDYRAGMTDERLREKMGLSKISWRDTQEKLEKMSGGRPETAQS